jgi:hypothetical protein
MVGSTEVVTAVSPMKPISLPTHWFASAIRRSERDR